MCLLIPYSSPQLSEEFILASEKKKNSPSLISMPAFILRTKPALNYLQRFQRSLIAHQHMGK